MKGIVFTELESMITERYGMDMWDEIIDASELPSGGSYTSVGNYPSEELHQIVSTICDMTQLPQKDVLRAYGGYLGSVFVEKFPEFFEGVTSTIALLMKVDGYIHVEVRKLYPDASLPKLDGVLINTHEMTLEYQSPNCLSYFAEGLIHSVGEHFNEHITLQRIEESDDGQRVMFHIKVTSK